MCGELGMEHFSIKLRPTYRKDIVGMKVPSTKLASIIETLNIFASINEMKWL